MVFQICFLPSLPVIVSLLVCGSCQEASTALPTHHTAALPVLMCGGFQEAGLAVVAGVPAAAALGSRR